MALASINPAGLKEAFNAAPNSARVEEREYIDSNGNIVKHVVAVFAKDFPVNPELIFEFPLPIATYATSIGAVYRYFAELPLAAGAVVWEMAVMILRGSTALNVVNLDAWGTPTVVAADTVPATAGQIKVLSTTVAIAFMGNIVTPAAGDICRLRLRRLNSAANPTDTLAGPAYILGGVDIQST